MKSLARLWGAYDMRVGDAHPTSSKIGDALKLAGIDDSESIIASGGAINFQFWSNNLVDWEATV